MRRQAYALRRETKRADQSSADAIASAQDEFDRLKEQIAEDRSLLEEKRVALAELLNDKEQAEMQWLASKAKL